MTASPLRPPATLCDAFSVRRSDVTTLSGNPSFALYFLTNQIPDPSVRLLSPTDFGEEPVFSMASIQTARGLTALFTESSQQSLNALITIMPHTAQNVASIESRFFAANLSRNRLRWFRLAVAAAALPPETD